MIIAAIDVGIVNMGWAISHANNKWCFGVENIGPVTRSWADICLRCSNVLQMITCHKPDVVLVEKQMTSNIKAVKLEQHIVTWLWCNSITVIQYPSQNKTKKLGAHDNMSYYQRKAWTVNYALSVLSQKECTQLSKLDKQNDAADAICMILSYRITVQFNRIAVTVTPSNEKRAI
jgi:Poxvirus A22 protein